MSTGNLRAYPERPQHGAELVGLLSPLSLESGLVRRIVFFFSFRAGSWSGGLGGLRLDGWRGRCLTSWLFAVIIVVLVLF
jgi:hypothetical protein